MFLINCMRTSIGHFTNHVKCPMIFCITNDVEFVLVRRGGNAMMTIGNDYSQPRLNKCQNGRCFNEKVGKNGFLFKLFIFQ